MEGAADQVRCHAPAGQFCLEATAAEAGRLGAHVGFGEAGVGAQAQRPLDVLERLAQQPGSAGFHLGTVAKGELLKRVMHEGPLPRKTFSMGEAHEKRYYVEARRIG